MLYDPYFYLSWTSLKHNLPLFIVFQGKRYFTSERKLQEVAQHISLFL